MLTAAGKRRFCLFVKVAVATLFLYAGASKVIGIAMHGSAPDSILSRYISSRPLPNVVFGTAESLWALSIALLIRRTAPLLVSFAAIALFTGAVLAELRRDAPKPCGCGLARLIASGQDDATIRSSLKWSANRNAGLLSLIALAIELGRSASGGTLKRIASSEEAAAGIGPGVAPLSAK